MCLLSPHSTPAAWKYFSLDPEDLRLDWALKCSSLGPILSLPLEVHASCASVSLLYFSYTIFSSYHYRFIQFRKAVCYKR